MRTDSLRNSQLAEQFSAALRAVGGEVRMARDAIAAQEHLNAVLAESGVQHLVHHAVDTLAPLSPHELGAGISAHGPRGLSRIDHRDLCASADAGLTGALVGIAATGTLVLAAGRDTPRSTSLLPPLHIALLHSQRIVPDLASSLRLFSANALPSQLVHITGPSRTGDIEHDLTTGVHGPARLLVILLDPNSESSA
ncbi:MAG: hypothetical protein EXS14_06595 [Planctomycetes bacterium]|nr:hypothetical protein [Planctomycetota bacterium]